MNLYNYDKNTKEYLSTTLASADPMETKIKGEFVPLVPAYSTLMEPPKTDKNEVAIFNGEAWEIKKDFRVSHKICDENFNIKDITEIGEIEEKYLPRSFPCFFFQILQPLRKRPSIKKSG